jgi:hypothetical protein
MAIRIHDRDHNDDYRDRFNQLTELPPGYYRLEIPLSEVRAGARTRPLDMTRIAGLKLFAVKPLQPVRIVVGNFRLE